MVKIVPEIDKNGLREFGFVTATIISLLFGLLLPYLFDRPLPDLPLAFKLSVGLSALALILPVILKPLYVVWMYIGFVLGWINTRIILCILFYVLFTPAALVMKIFRKDPMHRKITETAKSYRQSSHRQPKHHMEKPY